MESVNAYLFSSPGSILVAFVTVAFLLRRAWPRFSRTKQTSKLSDLSDLSVRDSRIQDLSVLKEPEVPEGWWTDPKVFELERRALFSQSWMYLAHVSQFSKPGAYQSFDLAGFPIFLIRGKDSQIRAFHNVCRHRAYTITRKETGASTVLGCRYHGWSYDTVGRLVKAPQFDDVPGFERSENGLFEIHTNTTEHGWIFVNLNASQPGKVETSMLSALHEFASPTRVGPKSKWVTGGTLTGAFNWKIGTRKHYFADMKVQLGEQLSAGLAPSLAARLRRALLPTGSPEDCSLFPNTRLYSFENSDLWLSLTFLPESETSTRLRYDLFDNAPNAETDEGILAISVGQTMQNLVEAIKSDFLLISAQPADNSVGTLRVLNQLQEHSKLEKTRGGPVMPASRQPKASSLFQQAEKRESSSFTKVRILLRTFVLAVCKELDCATSGPSGSGVSGQLNW